jgi:hypothetical protein
MSSPAAAAADVRYVLQRGNDVTREMPIFTRTFDLLAWLMPATNHFPRSHRHTVTRRLLDAAFDLRERLEEANLRRKDDRRRALSGADEALARFRLYVLLASRLGWLSEAQYGHVSTIVAEIGRLLGGWQKVTAATETAGGSAG